MKFSRFIFLSVLIFIITTNCKEANTKNNHSAPQLTENIKPYNFDSILKCGYYSYNDNFFVTADHGCIYKQDEKNNFGNIAIYLISKEFKNSTLNEIESYENYVNNLEINNLKKEFDIYIYLISKEYLTKTPEGYYQKEKYIKKLYTYNSNSKKWELLKSKNINNINDEQKDIKEISHFITEKINTFSSNIDKWKGTYNLKLEGLVHMDESHNISYVFKIKNDPMLITQLDDEEKKKISCNILKVSKDTLFFQEKNTNQKSEYKLFKTLQGDYIIGGHSIYMINPPNENYAITKE